MNLSMPRDSRGVRTASTVALAAVLLLVWGAAMCSAAGVSGVNVAESGGALTVSIQVDERVPFAIDRRDRPSRLVVSLPGAQPTSELLASPTVEAPRSTAAAKVLVLDGSDELGGPGTLVVVHLTGPACSRIAYADDGSLRLVLDKPSRDVKLSRPGANALSVGGRAGPSNLPTVTAVDVAVTPDGTAAVLLTADAPLLCENGPPTSDRITVDLPCARLAPGLSPAVPGWVRSPLTSLAVAPVDGPDAGVRVSVATLSGAEFSVTQGSDSRKVLVTVKASPGPEAEMADVSDGGATATVAGQGTEPPALSGSGGWEGLGPGTVVQQNGGTQVIPGPRRPPPGGAKAAPGIDTPPVFLREGTITLDFPLSSVRDVLTGIAQQADLDIVIDDGVAGDLSLSMTDVTPEEAIATICVMKGLGWKKTGQTYIVATPDKLPVYSPNAIVQSYAPRLTGDDALTKLEELLKKLHPAVFVQLYTTDKRMLLVGDPSDVASAIRTLQQADGSAGEAVMGAGADTTEVYTCQSGKPDQLGAFVKQVVQPATLEVLNRPETQQIVLKGSRATVAQAVSLLQRLEAEGGRISTKTYKPARVTPNVVLAAVKEGYPGVVAQITDNTLLVTGTEKDTTAAIDYAKAVDVSLPGKDEAVSEYAALTPHVRGLARLAEQAFAGTDVTIQPLVETKVVIVSGPKEQVDACVEKLRFWDSDEGRQTVTRNIKVEYLDAAYAADMLTGLVIDPDFTATASGEMVALTGPSIAVAEAEAVLQETDIPAAVTEYGRNVVSERYVLSYLDVKIACGTLEDVFKSAMMTANGHVADGTPPPPRGAAAAPPGDGLFPQDDGLSLDGAGGPFGTLGGDGEPPSGPTTGNGGLLTPPMGAGPVIGPGPGPTQPTAATEGAPAAVTSKPESAPPPLIVTPDPATHSLLLTGQRWAVERAKQILVDIDVPPHQVVIECIIADVERSYLKRKGVDWTPGMMRAFSETFGGGLGFGRFGDAHVSFGADFEAEKTQGKATLLANPSLRAIDGAEGRIQIGDQLRFQVLQPQSAIGQPIFTTETVDVGIILKFKPRVSEDGNVCLELHAESSALAGILKSNMPQIKTRNADTSLILRDGETIVIGGLIRDEEVDVMKTVPLLSEIPVLGNLFRHRSVTRIPQELVFFITPRILRAGETVENSEDYTEKAPSMWTGSVIEGGPTRLEDVDQTTKTPAWQADGWPPRPKGEPSTEETPPGPEPTGPPAPRSHGTR